MSWLEALVLGVVQGLTEFLPVSSSAHLRILGALAGWPDPGAAFTAIIQIGTELAVLVYFARDIARIVTAWVSSLVHHQRRGDPDARMGWLIVVGSIPIVVLGLLLQDTVETTFRDLRIVATALIVFSLFLLVADRVGRKDRTLDQLTVGHGVAYGFAQALALVPGVSRSGATITAGLAMGYERAAAARYSFLLAIPAVLGSGFYKLADVGADPNPAWGPILLATVVAFAVGLAVIHFLLRYVSHHSFLVFVVYRIALAAVVAVLLLVGVLEPLPQP